MLRGNCNLWITQHTDGTKMDSINSISTSCLVNPRCIERSKNPNSICSHCFAEKLLKCRKNINPHLLENTRILTEKVWDIEDLPKLNSNPFRFESFGDLVNDIQLINYTNIAKKSAGFDTALWTKNLDILREVFINQGVEKASNMQIVISSPFTNVQMEIPEDLKPFIDKVFTVYDEEYAREHNININCGARHCASCMNCYESNDILYINELLK